MADVGLTTREACGNAVRNITGCPFAGVAPTELFDVSPYADAVTRHLLRGPYSSALPRKFKIAFGGCCGFDDIQAQINDLGFLTAVDAHGNHGFKVYMGGGLSTLRKAGILVHEFLPVTEVLEVSEAVVRTFHRLGNRKDKHKARLKWAIQKLGTAAFIEEYKKDLAAVRAEGGRPLAVAPAPKPRAVPEAGAPVEALPEFAAFAEDQRPRPEAGRVLVGDRAPAEGGHHAGAVPRAGGAGRQVRRGGDSHHQRAEPGDALRADLARGRAAPRADGGRSRAGGRHDHGRRAVVPGRLQLQDRGHQLEGDRRRC